MREGEGRTNTAEEGEERERERQTYKSTERKLLDSRGGRGNRKDGEACGEERSASGRQQFLVECWKTSRGT